MVDEVETLAIERVKKLFGAEYNNTQVNVISFTGWNDYTAYSGWTEAQVQQRENQIKSSYNVSQLRSYTYKYNCHSYAWYSQGTSNSYWMENPYAYMTDGSYSLGTASVLSLIHI